ncbi:8050_t:CDS:1 [Acaulospora morrowiae]|uniref:8050_t:CDS:1 n=1 Tax=Acaulospora morrowiae TaxID=94023 RepID=A0A9N8V5R0_9GLOM|nr:8050_t:CDS:1 [Acaulospora morrowiae]
MVRINNLAKRRRFLSLRVLVFTLVLYLTICFGVSPSESTNIAESSEQIPSLGCEYLANLIKTGKHPSIDSSGDPSQCPYLSNKPQDHHEHVEYHRRQVSDLCPYIRELSKQKKERLSLESSLTKQIFAFLFPGSPRVNSLLGTLYISSIPNFILYFVPPDIEPSSLNSLVSFAVGGLLGDVFLHLLPQSLLGEHDDDEVHFVQVNEKKNVVIGLAIFFGLMTFFVIDKLMRIANGGEDVHSHSHSHAHDDHHHGHSDLGSSTATPDSDSATLRQRKSVGKKEDEDIKSSGKTPSPSIKLSAYLNLIADATHNFTDGLAMAASFYTSPSIGATTTVAVFFHEIPHEVGDYAILIQSGFTKKRAMLSQFVTAIGAFLGTLTGIAIEELGRGVNGSSSHDHHDAGIWGTGVVLGDLVIPFTAGGFLYIATVGVIPELLEVTGRFTKDIRQAATEFIAMLIGVGMMAVIAWNEGD